MAADKEAVRTIRSAADETADTARTTARTTADVANAGANLARQATGRSADTAKRVAEQASREFNRFFNLSAEASQDAAQQFNQNLDALLQVGTVVASGYQSITSEWSKYAQQAAQRTTDAVNEILKARNPRDLFGVQSDLLKDSVQELLSASARVSELSAQVAHEAVEKLTARAQAATNTRR